MVLDHMIAANLYSTNWAKNSDGMSEKRRQHILLENKVALIGLTFKRYLLLSENYPPHLRSTKMADQDLTPEILEECAQRAFHQDSELLSFLRRETSLSIHNDLQIRRMVNAWQENPENLDLVWIVDRLVEMLLSGDYAKHWIKQDILNALEQEGIRDPDNQQG